MLEITEDKVTLWGVHVRDIARDRNLLVSVETTRARARHTVGFWKNARVIKLECRIVTPIKSLNKGTKGRPKRQCQ